MNNRLLSEETKYDFIKETNFNSFCETLNSVFYLYNLKTSRIDFIGETVETLLGYSSADFKKLGFEKIFTKSVTLENSLSHASAVDGLADEINKRHLVKMKNGNTKWIEDFSLKIKNQDLLQDYIVGILADINPIKEYMTVLSNENNTFYSVLDSTDIMFGLIDRNGRIIYANKKILEVTGYSNEDILGKPWYDFLSSQNLHEGEEVMKRLHNNDIEGLSSFENRMVTKSGEEIIIQWHNSALRNSTGDIVSVLSSGIDVTQKKKDENVQQIISEILEIANSEGDLNELFKYIHYSVGKLMPVENFYIALYDRENSMISFPYFIDKIDKSAPSKRFGKGLTEYVLTTGKPTLIDKEFDDKLVSEGSAELLGSQSAIWLGVPLKIQNSTVGVLAVQDYENAGTYTEKDKDILEMISYPISRAIERKKVEIERNQLISKLKDLNASKDKLFSLISHDLRSPFNSLLGFSEILNTEYDTLTQEEIKEYLRVIYDASKNLYGMTNNLLQFSRFQMGRFDFTPERINLFKIINRSLSLLKGNALKKQLSLTVDVNKELFVNADVDMVNSIVQNLVSNAIKFTNRGGDIGVFASITGNGAEKFVEVVIKDTGIGLSSEDIDKIFNDEIFSNPGTEREYGTGLGLLLVKEFVEKNGGQVKIESKLNNGTSFIFTLPGA